MAELKTKLNEKDPISFLNTIEPTQKREDSFEILQMMQEISKFKPKMWGDSIIGFGTMTYKYATGREGEWMKIGFSPRKQALTLYIMDGYEDKDDIMNRLGKYKTGKSCLYIKKLTDVDKEALKDLIRFSFENDSAAC